MSVTPARDSHEDLHAVLWMQTAAEYAALTTAIYARALPVLRRFVELSAELHRDVLERLSGLEGAVA